MDENLIEVNVGRALVTFDGRVIESFGATINACGRMHAATLKRVWIDDAGGKVWLRLNTFWDTSPVMVPGSA